MDQPFPLNFQPGIQRDGTNFDGNRATDALWCRWRLGRPRKMGGFKQITDMLNGIPRRIHQFYLNGLVYIHVGTTNGIQQVITDLDGNVQNIYDRTPETFIGGINTGFTMDAIYDTTSNVVQFIAHSVPDTGQLATAIKTVPFIGQIDSNTPLIPFSDPGAPSGTWTQPRISGGIVCVQPYVFDFDEAGLVQWSAPNLPLYLGVVGGSTGAGQARISAQKVVQGYALRGGGAQSPAAIFWTLSEVITSVFIGGTPVFAFNTVSPSSSILSSDSVVEYDGLYFWAGVDRILVYNGTVNEVPNSQNQDWFFNNITPGFEARTFAFKVPRYGEIWFCAPLFGATECSHAMIFNLRENSFYDTELPNGGRGAGYFQQGLRNPIMAGNANPTTNGYKLWLHEYGVDEVDSGGALAPIRSYFETPYIGGPHNDPPNDGGLSIEQFEPDLQMTGDMSIYIIGQANVNAPENIGDTVPIKAVPAIPQEELSSFQKSKSTNRLTRLHIESNVIGGNYISGRNLIHAGAASGSRKTS